MRHRENLNLSVSNRVPLLFSDCERDNFLDRLCDKSYLWGCFMEEIGIENATFSSGSWSTVDQGAHIVRALTNINFKNDLVCSAAFLRMCK